MNYTFQVQFVNMKTYRRYSIDCCAQDTIVNWNYPPHVSQAANPNLSMIINGNIVPFLRFALSSLLLTSTDLVCTNHLTANRLMRHACTSRITFSFAANREARLMPARRRCALNKCFSYLT